MQFLNKLVNHCTLKYNFRLDELLRVHSKGSQLKIYVDRVRI